MCDTNVIIAAFIKDGVSRRILMSGSFRFITPAFTRLELERHAHLIRRKSGLDHERFEIVTEHLFDRIDVRSKRTYEHLLDTAATLISDPDDAPFVALALAQDAMIWTLDHHFDSIEIPTISTAQLLSLID